MKKISAGVQDIIVPRGFSREEASNITKLIVERGAAIAEFQGIEAQQGIDAVTSALLGQTRSLKSLGVELSATLINERADLLVTRGYWIDYGKDGKKSADDVKRSVEGLNETQLKTVAALELIQERSRDGWKAFLKGSAELLERLASRAQDWLRDKLGVAQLRRNADTVEHLRDKPVKGFSQLFHCNRSRYGQYVPFVLNA